MPPERDHTQGAPRVGETMRVIVGGIDKYDINTSAVRTKVKRACISAELGDFVSARRVEVAFSNSGARKRSVGPCVALNMLSGRSSVNISAKS